MGFVFLNVWVLVALAALFCLLAIFFLVLLKQERERTLRTTRAMMGILEKRDRNLDGHSAHTQFLISEFYSALPWNMKLKLSAEQLNYAALLHDIGKLGIPTEILDKPGKLTDDEWRVIRHHPEISVDFVKQMGMFDPIIDWIRYHHERVDGSGYYGLKEKEIPLASKMLAIVDTFSAVTVLKSYKPARTYEDGIATLRLVAGTQLDQELVEIFCGIPQSRIEACAAALQTELGPITKRI